MVSGQLRRPAIAVLAAALLGLGATDVTADAPEPDAADRFGGSRLYGLIGGSGPDDRLLAAVASILDPGAAFGGSRLYGLIGRHDPDPRLVEVFAARLDREPDDTTEPEPSSAT